MAPLTGFVRHSPDRRSPGFLEFHCNPSQHENLLSCLSQARRGQILRSGEGDEPWGR
jgi:hypothetical protein